MADKLFIKHNLGSFQQPYIFQAPANSRVPLIRQTPAPYPYIANKQEPNIRQQPAPYPYIANGQEPNIRSQQVTVTYPTSARTQVAYQHRSPDTYPTIGITQTTYNYRSPVTYNHRSPFTYQHRSPFTYATQGITQVAYQHRTPFTYRNPVNAQQPLDAQAAVSNQVIRQGQATTQGNTRVPVEYGYQNPFPYPYRSPSTYPAIGITQTTYTHRIPFTYPTTGITQTTYTHRVPSTYPRIAQVPAPYSHPSPFEYQDTRQAQQPVPSNAQVPEAYPYIARTPQSYAYQNTISYSYQAIARNPFTYSYRSPSSTTVANSLYYSTSGTGTDLIVVGEEDVVTTTDGDVGTLFTGMAIVHFFTVYNSSASTVTLYAREDDNAETALLYRENGTSETLTTTRVVAQWTFSANSTPQTFRFVLVEGTQTFGFDGSPTAESMDFGLSASSFATNNYSSNVASSTSDTSTSYTNIGSGGFKMVFSGVATYPNNSYIEGSQTVNQKFDLSLQFARPGSSVIQTTNPLRFELEAAVSSEIDDSGGDPE